MRMKHQVHGFHVPHPGERESMLKSGWVDEDQPFPSEAKEGEAEAPKVTGGDQVTTPTRDELEAEAKALGITFRQNIGDAKLAERIQAAKR